MRRLSRKHILKRVRKFSSHQLQRIAASSRNAGHEDDVYPVRLRCCLLVLRNRGRKISRAKYIQLSRDIISTYWSGITLSAMHMFESGCVRIDFDKTQKYALPVTALFKTEAFHHFGKVWCHSIEFLPNAAVVPFQLEKWNTYQRSQSRVEQATV